MTNGLSERLVQLEQSIRRATDLIARLRIELGQAEAENKKLQQRLADQDRDLEELRERLHALEESQRDVTRLLQERKEILAQVDGMLKELDALEPP